MGLPEGTPRIACSEANWEADNPAYRNAPKIFPDDLPEEVSKAIQDAAIEAFKLLKLREWLRVNTGSSPDLIEGILGRTLARTGR